MGRSIEIARAFVRAHWGRGRRVAAPAYEGPVETAVEFEERFAERNVLGLTLEDARKYAERELAGEAAAFPGYSFGLSTGTMGRPGVFLTSEAERNAWIGTVLGKFLPWRMLVRGATIALILKHNNSLYATAGKRLHFFNAGAALEEWVERLCELRPEVLIGPPSVLERVAASKAFARRPFSPGLLVAGAEPLFPQDRTLLSRGFGIAPRVIYQAKEGFLAAECSRGSVHLNEDAIQFDEIAIARGRFVPVISDFTRTSQTYRRFRLDDVLIGVAGACACGSPFRRVVVEGRAQDVLLIGGEPVFPHEVNELLAPFLNGRDYQVTQVDPDVLRLAVDGGVAAEAAQTLSERSRDQRERATRVTLEPFVALTGGEKRRRVRRLFDERNEWLTGR